MKGQASGQPAVLIVEDSDEDFEALSRVFRLFGLEKRVRRSKTGEDCLKVLSKAVDQEASALRPLPGMILLDLNLPGIGGCAALTAIKTHPILKSIPVTIFTTSASPRDIADCYAAGANAYVLKPLDYGDLKDTIRKVTEFWLRTAVLPVVAQ